MLFKIASRNLGKNGTWIDKWILQTRKIKQLIEGTDASYWSNKVTKLRLNLAGHIQRPNKMAWGVLHYKALSLWRERPTKVRRGSCLWRHPGRYGSRSWELDVEGNYQSQRNW